MTSAVRVPTKACCDLMANARLKAYVKYLINSVAGLASPLKLNTSVGDLKIDLNLIAVLATFICTVQLLELFSTFVYIGSTHRSCVSRTFHSTTYCYNHEPPTNLINQGNAEHFRALLIVPVSTRWSLHTFITAIQAPYPISGVCYATTPQRFWRQRPSSDRFLV